MIDGSNSLYRLFYAIGPSTKKKVYKEEFVFIRMNEIFTYFIL